MSMNVFLHHIYEFRKGLRNLVLYTGSAALRDTVEARLTREHIAYVIQNLDNYKINVYFGNPVCVDVVRSFKGKALSRLSAEEDFMLGTMLGYDRIQQCVRYLQRTGRMSRDATWKKALKEVEQ